MGLEIVAGLSLRNLEPRVWDPTSPFYIRGLRAVMVSFAEVVESRGFKERAEREGLRGALGVPEGVRIYLDNGAFALHRRQVPVSSEAYTDFVEATKPCWRPVPRDYIPLPSMSAQEMLRCLEATMQMNREYASRGYTPVIHISPLLDEYICALTNFDPNSAAQHVALGGIVPHLLRSRNSSPEQSVVNMLRTVRTSFSDRSLHIFGVGGTATIHLIQLLGINSADSSGWRNRAARGMIQLVGTGERVVANLGSWRGRPLSKEEEGLLENCKCPACSADGKSGLEAGGKRGFSNRATHNLFTLVEESSWVENALATKTYEKTYKDRLSNSTYLPLIGAAVQQLS